MEKYQLI